MNINIFEYNDYRPFIKDYAKKAKISFKSLAQSSRMHGSYFSRVMKDEAIFSAEQLYLIGKTVKLNPEELDFLLLLGEMCNSGDNEHSNFLRGKIDKIQKEKAKLLNKFESKSTELSSREVALYYQEAINVTVEIFQDFSQIVFFHKS